MQHVGDWNLRRLGDGNQNGVFNCPVEEKQLNAMVLQDIINELS